METVKEGSSVDEVRKEVKLETTSELQTYGVGGPTWINLSIGAHLIFGYDFVMMSATISVVGQVTTVTSLCRSSSASQETLTRCVLVMWPRAGLVPFLTIVSQALLSSNTRATMTSSLKMLCNSDNAGRTNDFKQAMRLTVSASGVDVLTHDCRLQVHARGI